LYKLTSCDLNRLYMWSIVDFWAKDIFIILLRFVFLVFISRTRLSLDFFNFERTSFFLRFGNFERIGFGTQIWRIE
jgi:hypothetical protein